MKFIRCDQCQKEVFEPVVTLNGIHHGSGILLPERFHEKHFCSPDCFWAWIKKEDPHSR
jgi:hypothetical protein